MKKFRIKGTKKALKYLIDNEILRSIETWAEGNIRSGIVMEHATTNVGYDLIYFKEAYEDSWEFTDPTARTITFFKDDPNKDFEIEELYFYDSCSKLTAPILRFLYELELINLEEELTDEVYIAPDDIKIELIINKVDDNLDLSYLNIPEEKQIKLKNFLVEHYRGWKIDLKGEEYALKSILTGKFGENDDEINYKFNWDEDELNIKPELEIKELLYASIIKTEYHQAS